VETKQDYSIQGWV